MNFLKHIFVTEFTKYAKTKMSQSTMSLLIEFIEKYKTKLIIRISLILISTILASTALYMFINNSFSLLFTGLNLDIATTLAIDFAIIGLAALTLSKCTRDISKFVKEFKKYKFSPSVSASQFEFLGPLIKELKNERLRYRSEKIGQSVH